MLPTCRAARPGATSPFIVDLLPKIEAALYGENDLTNGEVASIVSTLELLRPIAAGTSVIVPIEPTEKMIKAGWIDKEDVDPDEIYAAMIAAKEGE